MVQHAQFFFFFFKMWLFLISKLAQPAGLSSIGRYGFHWQGRKVGGPI